MNIVLRVRDHVKSTLFLSVGVCVCVRAHTCAGGFEGHNGLSELLELKS